MKNIINIVNRISLYNSKWAIYKLCWNLKAPLNLTNQPTIISLWNVNVQWTRRNERMETIQRRRWLTTTFRRTADRKYLLLRFHSEAPIFRIYHDTRYVGLLSRALSHFTMSKSKPLQCRRCVTLHSLVDQYRLCRRKLILFPCCFKVFLVRIFNVRKLLFTRFSRKK